jgi:oligoribonuclease (3'-5' exoribonuclease)
MDDIRGSVAELAYYRATVFADRPDTGPRPT